MDMNDDYMDYMDYLDNFSDDDYTTESTQNPDNKAYIKKTQTKNTKHNKPSNKRRRKGLKWRLLDIYHSKIARFAVVILVVLIIIKIIVSAVGNDKKPDTSAQIQITVPVITEVSSYQISGVPMISQDTLKAACETYACTMLLQYYNFDIDEFEFVDNYLITKPVYYGADGTLYGPDMNSAYAGDIYTGYGINAIGMAKCMNSYIKTTNSELTAVPLQNIPLEDICKKYIVNNIPVMVWATTYMDEPYVKANWVVDYADDDSPVKVGDTVSWQMHEHCMVLIGFDAENYYFCDSVSGKVSAYDKATSEERYSQIGMQAIVLE